MAPINQKDLEAISAYIDHALDTNSRGRLEARLRNEPELRAELENLRFARQILRSTPQFRSPRNFTLTPEMVGAGKPARNTPFTIARFAFALASAFLVFSLVGSYTFGGLPAALPDSMAASEPEILAMEAPEAELEEAVEDEAQPESLSMESAEAAEAAPVEEAPMEETMPLPSGGSGVEEGEMVPPSGGGGMPPEPTTEDMQAFAPPIDATQAMVVEEAVEQPVESSEDSARTMVVEGDQVVNGESIKQSENPGEEPSPAVEPSIATSSWVIAAWISGAAAVLSGGLALALRKR